MAKGSDESEAHAAVGRAVLACQILETAFALSVQLQFEQADAQTLAHIRPLQKNFSKPPTKALLARLKQSIEISPEFERILSDLVDRRHKLIHRWGIEESFPETQEQFRELRGFAITLAEEAVDLTAVLISSLANWAKQYPELAAERGWETKIPERFRSLTIPR